MALERIDGRVLRCTGMQQVPCVFAWTAEKNYVAGTHIEIRGWKLRSFGSWRYTRMSMENADITYRWKVDPSVSERRTNPNRVIFRARLPYGVRRGETRTIWITVIPPIYAGIEERLSVWILDVGNNFQPDAEPPAPFAEEESVCVLPVVAGPLERLSIYSRPTGAAGATTVRTVISPQDRFGNPTAPAEPFDAELTWQGSRQHLTIDGPITLDLPIPTESADSGDSGDSSDGEPLRAVLSVPLAAMAPGDTLRNGTLRDVDALRSGGEPAVVVSGNPVWPPSALPVTDGVTRYPAFGEFHWHTDFSGDGQRPIEEALAIGRDVMNLDFVAPADHTPAGEKWRQTVAALEKADDPGTFATIFGWEFGGDRGHQNFYFTEPDHPMIPGGEAELTGGHPEELVEALSKQENYLTIPHHTNAVAETRKIEDDSPYWHPYPWSEPIESIRLVEIMQTRGNQERNEYTDAWRGWHQYNDASVQDALSLGYKLGFTGGTDNHCGWPGRAFEWVEGAGHHSQKSEILTGVWTERIGRHGIFEALYDRHTWAVWDTRAIVLFTVNESLMGSEIVVPGESSPIARVRISAEAPLYLMEIVSAGEVVWRSSSTTTEVDTEVKLPAVTTPTHFYLRALSRDGGILYASPVFVSPS